MASTTREEALKNVVGQLAAVNIIRRRLWRSLPRGLGAHSAALAILARCGEMRMTELADHLDLDISVVSRQMAQLERQGTVTRRANPQDRRSCLIGITEQGTALTEVLGEARNDLIARATADWSPEQLSALAVLLERLQGGLAAEEDIPSDTLVERVDAALRSGGQAPLTSGLRA